MQWNGCGRSSALCGCKFHEADFSIVAQMKRLCQCRRYLQEIVSGQVSGSTGDGGAEIHRFGIGDGQQSALATPVPFLERRSHIINNLDTAADGRRYRADIRQSRLHGRAGTKLIHVTIMAEPFGLEHG